MSKATTLKKLKTPAIIFGGNVFGWTLDEKSSFSMLDELYENGLVAIDTADAYSTWIPGNKGGESEMILGKWMKERGVRDKMIITTKVGMEIQGKSGLKKAYIQQAIEDSLKRLKTDYIDAYLAHQEDQDTLIEETLEAFQEIKNQCKAKVIGASNYSFAGFKNAIKVAKEKGLPQYSVYQPEYNLYDRDAFENTYQDFCAKNQIEVVTYFSLASGYLSGKYRTPEDATRSQRGQMVVDRYHNERGIKILKALDQISEEKNVAPATVAISWLIHQESITAPIVSATNSNQLKELIKACELKLTPEDLDLLNSTK